MESLSVGPTSVQREFWDKLPREEDQDSRKEKRMKDQEKDRIGYEIGETELHPRTLPKGIVPFLVILMGQPRIKPKKA